VPYKDRERRNAFHRERDPIYRARYKERYGMDIKLI